MGDGHCRLRIGGRHGIVYLRADTSTSSAIWNASFSNYGTTAASRGVGGRPGFDFDIRIQMGAGSYVCGEESALIGPMRGNGVHPG